MDQKRGSVKVEDGSPLGQALGGLRRSGQPPKTAKVIRRLLDCISLRDVRPPSNEMLHLDALRFIAAAGIVYHHSHEFFWPKPERAAVISHTAGVALFVDLFFIISGFVISTVYAHKLKGPRELARFYQKRVARLGPLHWLLLLIHAVLWYIVLKIGVAVNHFPSLSPLCILDEVVFLHAAVPCGNGIFLNTPSWSISAEMFMYAAFPFLLFAISKIKVLTYVVVIVFYFLVWYVYGSAAPADAKITAFPFLVRGAAGFIFGMMLYNFRSIAAKVSVSPLALWGTAICLLAAMLLGVSEAILYVLICAVVILAIIRDCRETTNYITELLSKLGQLTYGIYMWHYLVIMIVMNLFADKVMGGGWWALIMFPVTVASIYLISTLSYSFFEMPARRFIDRLGATSAGIPQHDVEKVRQVVPREG